MNLILLLFVPLMVVLAHWPVLLGVYIHHRLVIRREHVGWLLRTLSTITSRNLPLAPAVRAAAEEERGVFRRRVERMADHLGEGNSLAAAIRISFPIVPGDVVGALDGAERAGILPGVLRRLARQNAHDVAKKNWMIWTLLFWTGIMVIGLLSVMGGFMFVIRSHLTDIVKDFGEDIPPFTQAVFGLFGANRAAPYGIIAIAVLIMLLKHMLFHMYNSMRRPDRFEPFAWIVDSATWFSPLRRYANLVALARQTPLIQMAVEAGHDLPSAARHAAYVDANWYARRRLLRFAETIESGSDPLSAARVCRMPGPFILALHEGRSGGNLGGALEYLSDYYASLRVHWERVIVAILAPLLILLMGLAVFCVVYAVLLPIQSLIASIMQTVY